MTSLAFYNNNHNQGGEMDNAEDELESEYTLLQPHYLKQLRKKRKSRKEKKRKAAAEAKKGVADVPGDADNEDEGPDVTLQDGEVLPQYYGKCPDHLLQLPIEDLDHYYKERGEETFCVVTERFSNKYIYRFSASEALFILSPFNPIRKLAIKISVNQFFDYFVMLTIIVNCVFLALDNEIIESEYVFTAIYTLEMIIKIIARGFIMNKFTYLRDAWNWLDFIVVVLAYATIITANVSSGNNLNVSGLRTFRVLRALKSFTIVPGLKTIINALLQSLKPLAEVMVIMAFLVVVISLIALQAYRGVLLRKCVLVPTEIDNITTDEQLNDFVSNPSNWNPVDGELQVCGNASSSGLCPPGYKCMQDVGENPNHGYTNFDHFGWAMLTSFQLLTLDFWENVYNMIIRAEGAWNVLFFFMSVILGPFYLLNLLLAVVTLAYSKEHEKQIKLREMREKAKENARRRNKRRRLLMQRAREREEMSKAIAEEPKSNHSALTPRSENGNLTSSLSNGKISPEEPSAETVHDQEGTGNEIKGTDIFQTPTITRTSVESLDHSYGNDATHVSHSFRPSISQTSFSNESTRRQKFRESRKNISTESSESATSQVPEWKKWFRRNKTRFRNTFCAWTCPPRFVKVQKVMMKVVKHKLFEGFIVLSILANTLFLSLDHHGISKEFEFALDVGNWVFTGIFTAEAIMKIFAMGVMEYAKNKWNLFDFIIVLVSWLEFGLADTGGLSVLRSLRLMRVFRLARIWRTMRKLMSIILKSLSAVAYLTIVVFMVLFTFAVIGKELYGDRYAEHANTTGTDLPRWNFTNFYFSFLLVWRVMCGEWIEPLHDCMFIVDYSCIPIFLLITFIGNFLVLNLFTAILLEAFNVDNLKSKQVDKRTAKLKLGVETFKKLLKKQNKSRPANSVSPEDKSQNQTNNSADAQGISSSANDAPRPPQGRTRSLSTVNIFALNQASQRSRYHDNGNRLNVPSPRESPGPVRRRSNDTSLENDTTVLSNHVDTDASDTKPKQRTLRKQHSISEDNVLCVKTEGDLPMTIIEVDEEEFVNKIEAAPVAQGRKVTFADNENANGEEKKSDNKSSNAKKSTSWYRKTCPCCFGSQKTQNDSDVEMNSNPASPENETQYGPDDRPRKKDEKEKEAPDCFPKWCMCKCCSGFTHTRIFEAWIRLRLNMYCIVEHKIFEWCILFIILASTVCLAMEDVNLDKNPDLKRALEILEYIFTSLFTLEMTMKWLGIGFRKYFTSWWCLIDFMIVVISWIGIGASGVDSLKALRTLRALRPLRAISRWQGMRVVVNALVYCIPSIGNVLCVCMLIWLVFSIIGVQMFKGQFHRCNDASGEIVNASIVPNRTVCENMNLTWTKPPINFDHVPIGMVALFQVATFEGWIEIMSDASDTAGVDQQPRRDANQYAYLYFFVFVLIGSFFILNLIVGVIIESFQKLRKQTESSSAVEAFLTESQKNFYKTMRTMLNRKPKKTIPAPENQTQLAIFKLVTHSKFEVAVFIVIVLNMFTLGLEHYNMSDTWITVLRYVDITFTALFLLEAILKLTGTRLYYFRDPFNVFDFIVVLLSLTGFILEELLTFLVSPTLLRVVRVFRVFRVLRVIRAARGIRRLILTLMISLPALFNIAVLLAVFMIIFAICGMSFFMNAELTGALNDIVNFQTFGNSMMLLFRLMTSAGWNDVLDPLMKDENGSEAIAIIYFVAYIFFVFLVVVNMYIAIILENFDEIFQQEETGVSQDDFEYFYVVWGRYDPRASQFVSIAELSNLLHSLHPPFQLAKPNEIKIAALNLPIVNGDKVHCLDVLFALVKRIMGEVEISDEMREEAEARLLKSFPNRKTLKAETTTLALRQKVKAAKVIQEAWRGFHGKRRRGTDSASSDLFSLSSSDTDISMRTALPAVIAPSLLTIASLASERRKLSVVEEVQTIASQSNNESNETASGDEDAQVSSQEDSRDMIEHEVIQNEMQEDGIVKESPSSSSLEVEKIPQDKPPKDQVVDSIADNLNNNNVEAKPLVISNAAQIAEEKSQRSLNPQTVPKSQTTNDLKSSQSDSNAETEKSHKLDELRPSSSLNIIRNDHAFVEEDTKGRKTPERASVAESLGEIPTHRPNSSLKKQINVEKDDNAKQTQLAKFKSLDSEETSLSRTRPPALSKSAHARSTEDEVTVRKLKQASVASPSTPITGKNLKFNPQTGQFKAKTKSDDIELVSISRASSAKDKNVTNSEPQQQNVDLSLVIRNNYLENT